MTKVVLLTDLPSAHLECKIQTHLSHLHVLPIRTQDGLFIYFRPSYTGALPPIQADFATGKDVLR